ncbi:MAG: ABC transporter ATP-binding protein [Chitinispirillaceae bacterium]
MSTIEARDICFYYGRREILKNVSFTVGEGEAWAVIGRNGAGKTTLLKCLCGLVRPQSGSVDVGGAALSKLSPRDAAKLVAYVPQGSSRVPPPFTVRQFVGMARYAYSGFLLPADSECEKSVGEALALTDTEHLSGRMMDTLSGGEFQSVLLAGAVAQGASVLLLDEPTTFLDPGHQENVRIILQRINSEHGTAVVTVTHDINFALSVHSHILALSDGRVIFQGEKSSFDSRGTRLLSELFSVDFSRVSLGESRFMYHMEGVQR